MHIQCYIVYPEKQDLGALVFIIKKCRKIGPRIISIASMVLFYARCSADFLFVILQFVIFVMRMNEIYS